MDSILSDRNEDDGATGIFGKACLIYKFHGSVPHAQRHNMMKRLKAMIRRDARSCWGLMRLHGV